MAETRIDARGMRCPWPALRLARAMRDAEAEASIRIFADDPKAESEIAGLAAVHGWDLERVSDGGELHYLLRR